MSFRACAFVVAAAASSSVAFAGAVPTFRITEAHSTSSSTFGSDWFELTNFSDSALDITGWRFDDTSPTFATSVALSGITSIAPGESVVFIENAGGTNIPAFRTFWGGLAGVQVGYYSGSGVGLGSGGDAVNIFDTSETIIAGVTFGAVPAASLGTSFGYNPNTSTFGAPSVNGVFGARLSSSIGTTANPSNLFDVASPGVIPAPSAAAMLGLAGLALGRRRR